MKVVRNLLLVFISILSLSSIVAGAADAPKASTHTDNLEWKSFTKASEFPATLLKQDFKGVNIVAVSLGDLDEKGFLATWGVANGYELAYPGDITHLKDAAADEEIMKHRITAANLIGNDRTTIIFVKKMKAKG